MRWRPPPRRGQAARRRSTETGRIVMPDTTTVSLKIVSRSDWLVARKELLEQEKRLTRERDALNEARRRRPMVSVDKDYSFEGPEGQVKLVDRFQGRRQLIVYHFMFDPAWEKACDGCTCFVKDLPDLADLHKHDTSLAVIGRAPQAKLAAYRNLQGWDTPL